MTFCELALLVALTILVLVLALAVIAFFGYRRNWQWTGLPKYGDDDVERRYVTLWAWISVLLVPLTLAAAGVLFTGAQHRSSSAIQQQQREDDLAVQESRTQDERLRE
jgi:amino acid transporter